MKLAIRLLLFVFSVIFILTGSAQAQTQPGDLPGCTPQMVKVGLMGSIVPPPGYTTQTPYDFVVNSSPTFTQTQSPQNPNLLIVTQIAGSYSYKQPSWCIGEYVSGVGYNEYWVYTVKTAPLYAAIDLTTLVANAIVSNTQSSLTLDMSKIPLDQCNLSTSYQNLLPNNLLNIRSCSYNVVAHVKAPEERCYECERQVSHGDPFDTYSRNYYHHETDLSIAGLMPLGITRTYYSGKSTMIGEFGVGSYLADYNYRLTMVNPSTPVSAPNTVALFNPGNNENIPFSNLSAGGQTYANNTTLGTTGDSLQISTGTTGLYSGAVYTKLNKSRYTFDAKGFQTSQTDRFGNQRTFSRDASGRLIAVTDATTNRKITISYNSAGLISQIADNTGRTVNYTYSPAKELLSVTDPTGHTVNYQWTNHKITSKTDWQGNTVMTATYDNTTGGLLTQTLADGKQYSLQAPSDTVRIVTQPDGGTVRYVFNAQGNLIEADDALNNATKMGYSAYMYSNIATGRYTQTTDPLGNTVRTDMNGLNLPTLITDPLGQKTSINYNTKLPELVNAITDPLGHKVSFSYDSIGNLINVTDNAGNASSMTYNTKGQLLTATNVLGQKTTYVYDSLYQLSSVTNALGQKVQYTYDTLGRLASVTDPSGFVTSFTYDALDRVISSKNALGQVITYNYDANGNLISQTDARGKTTTLTYDAKGRLTQGTNPLGKTSLLTYTGADLVKTSQDPKSQLTSNTYDLANRLTKIAFADNSAYQFSYDAASRMLNVTDGSKSWGYMYDKAGRVTVAAAPLATLNYSYNANSNLTQMTSSQYGTVNYGYDNLDRVISINKDNQNYIYSYDPLGNRTSLTRPNGTMTVYEYDAGNRLSALTHVQGTTVPERYEYSYDLNGNISKIVRGQGTLTSVKDITIAKGSYKQVVGYTRNSLEELEKRFTYDSLNRLTNVVAIGYVPGASSFKTVAAKSAAQTALAQARAATTPTAIEQALRNAEAQGAYIPENATWTFDANGNIATKVIRKAGGALETRTFTYDDADRLIQMVKSGATMGTITYSYDANGNMISDSTGRQMTWNAQDQLIGLNVNGNALSFAYDPLGRRVSYTKTGTLKTYFYNGQNMLSDGTNKFLTGVRLDEALQEENSSGITSYLQDHLGSSSQLLNSSGASLARYDYKSYGKLEGDIVNPVATNPTTYTGREDDGIGLMYYRARYYDPELEAFVSQDPLGDAQRYVRGNSLSYTDPLGLLVVSTYSLSKGILSVLDIDTNKSIRIRATSGANSSPIPPGIYEILEGNPNSGPDFFRLDPVDSNPRDYIDNGTGRYGFNLHRPGHLNYGCIAGKDYAPWTKVRDFIRSTRTTQVIDRFHSIEIKPIPFLFPNPKPYIPSNITKYGYLQVVK